MTNSERGNGEELKPFTFEDIAWNGRLVLADETLLARNLGVMRLFLDNGGTPREVIFNDYAYNLPKVYGFGDVDVEFLPHWQNYYAGSLLLNVPESADVLLADLEAARYVASRQPAQ